MITRQRPTEEERLVRTRSVSIDVVPPGSGSRSRGNDDPIELALSSESPVERYNWWEGERYLEVLDHSPGAIDLSYAKDGLPFLLHHDTREMIGLLEDVRVDGDRRIRARVRFSRAARAQEIRQDILDGIRKKVSVGYRLTDDYEQVEGEEGAIPTRRYRNWRPMEASSVPIPADYDVGIGRSAPPLGATPHVHVQETRSMTAPTQAPALQARTREQEASDILSLCEAHGYLGRASEWIRGGATADQVATFILQDYRKNELNVTPPASPLSISSRERRPYSIARLIASSHRESRVDAGYEREVSQELGRTMPSRNSDHSLFVPYEALAPGQGQRSQLTTITANKGAETVFTHMGEFIDFLRGKSRLMQAGARTLPGLQGNVAFPRKTGTGGASWVGEAPGAGLASTSLSLDQPALAPKMIQSVTTFSRLLTVQGTPGVEQLVREDMAGSHGEAIDVAGINGAGTGNVPRGVLQLAGVNAVAIGTNGGVPTYDHLVDMEAAIESDNAAGAQMAYITTPGIKARLKKTQKFATTNGESIWTGGAEGVANGHSAYSTTLVPSTLVKGTSTDCHAILFGDFSQMLIGMWGAGFEIIVDPYTLADRNLIKVVSFQAVNIAHRHAEAFAIIADARVA